MRLEAEQVDPIQLTLHGKVDSLEGASLSQGVQNVKDEENEKTVHGRV